MNAPRKPGLGGLGFTIDLLKGPALALGSLLILSGFGSWLISGFDTITRILLAVGILLFGIFVAIDPEDVWRHLTTRGTLYSGNALLLGAVIIGIIGLANVVAINRHQRWDLTANKQFSLSDQTISVIADLPQAVTVTAFYEDDDQRKQEVTDLLKEYELKSGGKLSFELVDPTKQPSRAQLAQIKEYGTAVFTMADRRQTVTGSRESDFTTALLRLLNPTQKKIYFTTGHNERRLDGFDNPGYGQLKSKLEADNYVIETLVVASQKQVPEDAAAVVIANPRVAFSDEEKQAVLAYLNAGGKLMLLAEPTLSQSQPQVSLNDFIAQWGVEITSAPVIEGDRRFAFNLEPLAPVIVKYSFHKITEGLPLSFFPTVASITVPTDNRSGAVLSPLAQTSEASWAETNMAQPRFDQGADPKGPLTIALAIDASPTDQPPVTGQTDEQAKKKVRVVVFADADFASNGYSLLAEGNRDLFLNAINWLAEEEQLIAIRPKERDSRQMFLTEAQANFALFSSALFLPLIVLGVGATVWWSRRG